MHSSRPFITEKGYVGLCPDESASGDAIFIPSGGHVPYIVRDISLSGVSIESPGSWRLIGEAFVYGLMDNELQLESKQGEARLFRLC